MKRIGLAVLLLAIALPACAGTERPEGIVERWLISLNQGAAGRPEAYAPDRVSDRVLPNREALEPGELDVIEVGRGAPRDVTLFGDEVYLVPFRLVDVDGRERRLVAVLDDAHGAWRVESVSPGPFGSELRLPSEGGPGVDDGETFAWLAALGAAALLVLLTIGLMRLVPEPQGRTVAEG